MEVKMKKLWNMLRGKARRDDRGLTFVEVLCAVAILALVAGVIGTVIVVSTRTYRKGISETGIQQEAQLAANNIGNLVKDACSVVYGESGQQYLENGEKLMVNPDSTPKIQTDGTTELSIITNEKIQYTVTYQKTEPSNPSNPLGRLFYQEFDASGNAGDLQIMANNIVDFSADTTDFKDSRTIKLKMTVEDEATNRRIPMEYTMTSRNDAVEGAEYVSHTDNVSVLFPDGDIVLVPGETYQIPLVVAGKLTEGGLEWESTGGLTGGALTLDYAEVTVPVGTTATEETIVVHTKDKDEVGNYKATASCKVIIRRVERVEVTHATDTTNSTGGMYETAGTVYTFTASVSGNELVKHVAYDYDMNYKTAQAVAWSCVLKLNGTESKYEWTSAQNGAGEWEFTAPDFTAGAFAQYFEVDTASTKEDALVPSFVIKAKEAMPAGLELTVRATSKHALGVNKANSKYYDGLGSDPVNIYYGEDTIRPRETKLSQDLEITLEPHETGKVAVGMKGGLSSDVTFDFHDATDVRPDGTNAVYNEADDTVEITLGKDEKGSGKTGAVPFTFTIDVKVSGVVKTTITVHVCRIDELSIAVIDNFKDNKGNTMNLPTYDFRARFNVDNGSVDDMQNVVKNLIQYKPDGTVDEEAVKKTLSSKITWELIDHGNGSKVLHKDSVICMAGVGEKGETIGNYTKEYKKDKKSLYEIVHVKPARIEKDGSGNWYIKQLPEVDISPSANTPTGLLKNYELKVTIEALHPLGTENSKSYNKTGKLYKEDVEASASIFGDMTISAPTQLVIVEPGQGINSKEQSDKEMVIPISVGGVAVYSMSATLKEKSSSDTQLAVYPDGNPYRAEGATSASNKRTWYLGLLIGKDEVGNHAGRIKVHIDAYNTSKEIVASTDFELGVRRVNEVDVKLSGNINDVNKKDGTMTITASPSGCGNGGTEFYGMQEDNGKTCRWEQAGHGEYKEPSQMEWKMLLKDGDKPKPLSEWTEYIVKDTIKTSVDKENHKATVSFKLKQPLPNGTKIRAYSLHARGSNGKDEAAADYVKYNKSGKEYEKDLYGELVIGGRQLLGGFKRANRSNYTLPGFEAGVIPQFKAKYFNTNDFQQYTFFRYREVNGKWSQYYKTDDNENYHAYVTGTRMARLFRTDKEYELDVVNVLYNTAEKAIYWPQDNSLLESGAGWKEAGYKLKEWDYNSKFTDAEKSFQCKQEYSIPKTEIYFDPRPDRQTIDAPTRTIGSESEPIQINGNGQGDQKKWFAVYMNPTAFDLPAAYYNFTAILYKKVGNEWVEVQQGNMQQTEHWMLQTQNPEIQIGYTYGASGTYRICSFVKNMDWTDVSGDMFNPTYTTSYEDIPLYDLSDNTGVIFAELK